MPDPAITEFREEYHFLSSFYPVPELVYAGKRYPTVEHAYQAAKTVDEWERAVIRLCTTPGKAKRAGRKVTLRPDWEQAKVGVMHELLQQKFAAGTDLCAQLLGTGDRKLIEGNTWGDRFWGVCQGQGENRLGKLLMSVRKTRGGVKMFIAVAKHPALNLPNAVYVGRTKSVGKQYPMVYHQLANPFTIGKDGTREEVVVKYRQWLFQRIKIGASPIRYALLALLDKAKSSTGVVLVCHCTNNLVGGPLGDECHAQVIAKALAWMEEQHERTGFYPTCRSYWDAQEVKSQ